MNFSGEVLARMIKLFPIVTVKKYFPDARTSPDSFSSDIVSQAEPEQIFDFVHKHLDFTKQHTYFFSHNFGDITNLPDYALTRDGYKYEHDGIIDYEDFLTISYRVYLGEPFDRVDMEFIWPIRIRVTQHLVMVLITILEKNIRTDFPERRILKIEKSTNEDQIINDIQGVFSSYGILSTCDLNKGVKELWKADLIDAIELQYLKASSVSKETMNEECTFKVKYPEDYEKAINAPLLKTLFKFINNDGTYCAHFTIEPGSGKITFPIFSATKEQKTNVIQKILESN